MNLHQNSEVSTETSFIQANTLSYLDTLKHQVTEVRILRKDRYLQGTRTYTGETISGYYEPTSYEKLIKDIEVYNCDPGTKGIYTTLQDCVPELLHRAANRLELNAKDTTSDHDIRAFTVFPIDHDPKRPAGISASESELESAKSEIKTVCDYLIDLGIPESALAKAMSGNGWHLLVYLNRLENIKANAVRFKGIGDLIAEHFNLDQTIYNPSRIWKLYGTISRKGDDTKERPHRVATIWLPEKLERIDFADLESKVTSALGRTETHTSVPSRLTQTSVTTSQSKTTSEITLREWLDEHKITYIEKPYKGTHKYIVDCPHDTTHAKDAWITDEGGTWQFSCSHNSCKGERSTWAAFKKALGIKSSSSRSRKNKPKRQNPLPELKDASQYFIHDDFNVLAMSRYIQDKYIVWAQDAGIFIYDGLTGTYRRGENVIDVAVRSLLGELRKARYVEETLKDLNAICRRDVPDTSHLIAFQNGVLDLKTDDGTLCDFSEHSPENYLMSLFPSHFSTEFTETEGSKDFDAWLLDILDNDTGLHQVIYEVIGSIFHQRSTDMQRGILMVGEGGTGKSMLLEQIERMVGRENICGRAWSDYGYDSFAFGDLYRKSLALDSDIDVSRPLSGAIKPAVTGNTLICNQKYQQPFNFKPYATWIGSINKFPRTRDKTWGFFRRWIAVPFNKTFPTNSKFEAEKRKLWSDPDTISAIIYKAIGLYRAAYLNGSYTIPDAAAELSREMYKSANTVISWLDLHTTPDPEGWVTRSEAYQSYADYCISSGFEAEDTRNFFATLRSQGYNPDKKRRVDGKSERVIEGIRI